MFLMSRYKHLSVTVSLCPLFGGCYCGGLGVVKAAVFVVVVEGGGGSVCGGGGARCGGKNTTPRKASVEHFTSV